ncbi:MAG: tRNA (guanosine(46)-N7)-methyltransferase TrmB [Selenomonadaceae bacterium]|nr:tRNA (guanosine(46)-N7)-methyltransferase TrmB [Selenomonadaceae bacterium]
MRLRRKPWVDNAIHEFDDFVYSRDFALGEEKKGTWAEIFGREAPLYLELGMGKGDFMREFCLKHPEINFIGVELQQDVLYKAAQKISEAEITNARLLVFDITHIENIFAENEIDRIYLNFSDPWPKRRHAKRRLTHRNYLLKYKKLLKPTGEICFKTDNRPLFDFSIAEFSALNMETLDISYDLHAENRPDNIMTEYERKFSSKGEKICFFRGKFCG